MTEEESSTALNKVQNSANHLSCNPARSLSGDLSSDLDQTFRRAEHAGLKLAIIGRSIALVVLGAGLVFSRLANNPDAAINFALLGGTFLFLGLLHYRIIGTGLDRFWVKYLFITLDIGIISALIATQPLFASADLPAVMIFRSSLLSYFFVILGIAAFSFSPQLVLWSGFAGAAGYLGAFAAVASRDGAVLDWSDLPTNPTAQDVIDVVLNPAFGAMGSRLQEAVFLVVVAMLIAIVMRRAQNTLREKLTAERDRQEITGIFGRFVPEPIVEALIADAGLLAPVEREATIVFSDIVGFTSLTERLGPQKTVEVLNDYFDAMTGIVTENNGIVATFHGDAILAIFNVPLKSPDHADHALRAAQQMLRRVAETDFAGENLAIRIGINSGPVIAGNVGGGGRQSYTVYGDAVNLAARLEVLAKEKAVSLLLSEHSQQLLKDKAGLKAIGTAAVRGQSQPITIYTNSW
ncbi:adenylate/guanylate cyclase domain-containing protein [Kiloniella laminariae]|uniref:adenylate/guanylate cyclase domain-containing protein n=1 Tax=Kiloniella laminariae TaxID=454162 RepID=UPI00036D7351|nr:adenylate/guanylate cyclase domain-containing protein [Kiloniella laminariae]